MPFQIFVIPIRGGICVLNVEATITVKELKRMLSEKKHYCTYMMCCTKPLTDERTLAYFDIGPNSTINML